MQSRLDDAKDRVGRFRDARARARDYRIIGRSRDPVRLNRMRKFERNWNKARNENN